jgi:hypothetical protein
VTPEDASEIKPLSLAELGLSEEEIELLGLAEQGEPVEQFTESTPQSQPPQEPEPTPEPEPLEIGEMGGDAGKVGEEQTAAQQGNESQQNIEGLGLTDEELAILGGLAKTTDSSSSEAKALVPPKPPEPSEISGENEEMDLLDLNLSEEQLAEVAPVQRTAPKRQREEEEEVLWTPEDEAFQPEPLDALDDVWDQPDVQSEQPARIVLDRPKVEPSRVDEEPFAEREPPHREVSGPPVEERHAPPFPAARPHFEGREPYRGGGREPSWITLRNARATDRLHARSERPVASSDLRPPTKSSDSFIPTGNEEIDSYLRQLDSEPENYGLCLAIARVGLQTERFDMAFHHYKRLIHNHALLDEVVDDMHDFIGECGDRNLLQRLHRLLGDAYIKQKRFSEAIAAYNWRGQHG